ncbi:MAG: phosphoribosylaminoimidazolesuccinocarboxamide synthase [Elusimicrobiota bacterium]
MDQKLYKGKTKVVIPHSNNRLLMKFRDTVLGNNGQPDSGGDQVVGNIEGKKYYCMKLTEYFFQLLSDRGIENHYLETIEEKTAILVEKSKIFGQGLEFICRLRAFGSFLRRYENYIEKFKKLNYLVEITIKDDKKHDPLINDETLLELDIISPQNLKKTKALTKKVARIINEDLEKYGLELVDIKVEFGERDNRVAVIDTMNCDNMRIMDKKSSKFVDFKKLHDILIEDG